VNIIIKQCLNCNINFNASTREVNRGNAKFCSLKCSAIHHGANRVKPKPNVKCAFCDKEFYKNKSKQSISRSGLYFCCRKHKDSAQRIGGIEEIQPDHYGKGESSYRQIALREMPNLCNRCGYNKFIQVLVVHHKDHNRENNDLSNLEVLCPTCHWEHHLGLT
jgi:hypothetical protein